MVALQSSGGLFCDLEIMRVCGIFKSLVFSVVTWQSAGCWSGEEVRDW